MRKLLWSVLIAAFPVGGAEALSPRQAAVVLQEDEYSIKGALITQFIRMCDWPEKALPKDTPDFILGLVGPDEVCAKISKQTLNRKVGNRTIKILRGDTVGDLGTAHMIFLADSEKDQAANLVKTFRTSPVLTVSETPGFAQGGGVINFFLNQQQGKNKIGFELNLEAAERTGVKVTRLIPVATRKVKDD